MCSIQSVSLLFVRSIKEKFIRIPENFRDYYTPNNYHNSPPYDTSLSIYSTWAGVQRRQDIWCKSIVMRNATSTVSLNCIPYTECDFLMSEEALWSFSIAKIYNQTTFFNCDFWHFLPTTVFRSFQFKFVYFQRWEKAGKLKNWGHLITWKSPKKVLRRRKLPDYCRYWLESN